MTEKYFVEKLDPNEHTTNVYYALGPAASKLLHFNLDNLPQGIVHHTFLRWARAMPTPKVKKQDSRKEPVSVGRGKRKRAADVQNEQMVISEGETEEVEREVLDLTGYQGEMDVDEDDEEVSYGWSHSMCEPPPVKRRRRRKLSTEYAPDSESEREREQDVVLISSD